MKHMYITIILITLTATALADRPPLESLWVDIGGNTQGGRINAGYTTAAIAMTIAPDGSVNPLSTGLIGASVQVALVVGDTRYYWPQWTTEPSRSVINIPGPMSFEIVSPIFWPAGLEGMTLTFEMSIHDQWGQERTCERSRVREVEIQ